MAEPVIVTINGAWYGTESDGSLAAAIRRAQRALVPPPAFERHGHRTTWRRRARIPVRWGRCPIRTRWSWAPNYLAAAMHGMAAACFGVVGMVEPAPNDGAMARAFHSHVDHERQRAGVKAVFEWAEMTRAMSPQRHRVPRLDAKEP